MVLSMTTEGLKGPWQPEEDKDLIRAVELWGSEAHCWRSVSEEFNKTRPPTNNRSMKQCRERYLLHLRPDISNEPWTHDEDALIVQGHKQHGNKWQEIAKLLPGRTESSVKNHWNATLRRKFKYNDPAESAPLRKYIRELLESDDRCPANGNSSPMGSAGAHSQPSSAKKLRGTHSMGQQSQRMPAWHSFEPSMGPMGPMQANGVPMEEEEWVPDEPGVAGPNLLMGLGAASGGRLQRYMNPEQAGSAPVSRKGVQGMAGMGMGMGFPGQIAMMPPGMVMRGGSNGSKPSAHGMVQYMHQMTNQSPHMMFGPGGADAGDGGPNMLPSTSLRIQTKRPGRQGQHLVPGQGSASGSGGPVVSELTRVEIAGGRRAGTGMLASPHADAVGSDQDSLAASGGGTPARGRGAGGSQRTPHSHATHPMGMQWELPQQRFMAAAAAAGYPMGGGEEEEGGEAEEQGGVAAEDGDEGGGATAVARKRVPAGPRGNKKESVAEMMLGGALSMTQGHWPAAMMMMPQPQMMMAHEGEEGEEDGWENGTEAGVAGTGEGSPAAIRTMRKKGRMAGGMAWGPAMMMPMPMGMAAHPAAMQMMMQQHAMMQHMGMPMMSGGSGAGSPMAAGAMMPWGPWGMPMMMAGSPGHRKRKASKLARDGAGAADSGLAAADDAGEEEGSQAGGAGTEDGAGGGGGREVVSREAQRVSRPPAGDGPAATRVLPGQARVQRGGGGSGDDGGSHSRGTVPNAAGRNGDGRDEVGDPESPDEETESDGVRRSKRSTRPSSRMGGIGAAAATAAVMSGSPSRRPLGRPMPGGSGGAASDPEQQRSSHSQALKKHSSLQRAHSGQLSDGVAGPPDRGATSGARSRMAQQHGSAPRHATAPQAPGRAAPTDSGRAWSGRTADGDNNTGAPGQKRRRVAAEAEADSLFGTLLAAAAAIESEGDSLEQPQQTPQVVDAGVVDKSPTVQGGSGDGGEKRGAPASPAPSRSEKPTVSAGVSRPNPNQFPAHPAVTGTAGMVQQSDGAGGLEQRESGDHQGDLSTETDTPPVPHPTCDPTSLSQPKPSRSGRQAEKQQDRTEGEVEMRAGAGMGVNTDVSGGYQTEREMSSLGRGDEMVPYSASHMMHVTERYEKSERSEKSYKKGGGGGGYHPNVPKSKTAWSKMESDLLVKFVDEYGGTANTTPWTFVAHKLNTAMRDAHSRMGPGVPYCERTSKQCRERWIHNLAPHVCKDAWTEDENHTLAEAHKQYGNQWSRVARLLPGRTENTVKNHWNATLRRKQPARLPGGGISSLDMYMVMSGLKTYDPDTTAEIWAQIEDMAANKMNSQELPSNDPWQPQSDAQQLPWQANEGATGDLSEMAQATTGDDHVYGGGARGGRSRQAQQKPSAISNENARGGSGGGAGGVGLGGDLTGTGFQQPATAEQLLQQLGLPLLGGACGMPQTVMQAMSDFGAGQGLSSPRENAHANRSDVVLMQPQPLTLPLGVTWDQAPPQQQQPTWEQPPSQPTTWDQEPAQQNSTWGQPPPPAQQPTSWDQVPAAQQISTLEQLLAMAQTGSFQLTQMHQVSGGGAPPSTHLQPVILSQHLQPGNGSNGSGNGLQPTFSHGQLTTNGQGAVECATMWGQSGTGMGGEVLSPSHAQSSPGAGVSPQFQQLPQLPQPPSQRPQVVVPPPPQSLQQLNTGLQQFASDTTPMQQFSPTASHLQQQLQQLVQLTTSSTSGGTGQLQQFASQPQLQQFSTSSTAGTGTSQLQQFASQPQLQQFGSSTGGALQPVPLQQYSTGGGGSRSSPILYGGSGQPPPMPPPLPGGTWVYHQNVPNCVRETAGAGMQSSMERTSGGGVGAGAGGGDLPPAAGLLRAGSMGGALPSPLAVALGNR